MLFRGLDSTLRNWPGRQETIAWGPGPEQFGVLYRPDAIAKPPVVVMIHGGCWLALYDLNLQSDLSQALAERGFAVWDIEYRRECLGIM